MTAVRIVALALALTACGPSANQKRSPQSASTAAVAPHEAVVPYEEDVEVAASHVAFLALVVKTQPPDAKFYRACIAKALERLQKADTGNATYPNALRHADQEMTWCYTVHCVPLDVEKLLCQ